MYTPDGILRVWLDLQHQLSKCRMMDTYFIYRLVDMFKYMFHGNVFVYLSKLNDVPSVAFVL